MKNKDGDLLTIPYVTLQHLREAFSMEVLLTSRKIQELPEGQQIGYMRGAADLLLLLGAIHEGGE